MPNHSSDIKAAGHALKRYTDAAAKIRKAIDTLDTTLVRLERQQDLFAGERRQRQAEARATAQATIQQHRREMDAAVAEHRAWSQYSEDAPSADTAARRTYYATQAMVQLAGLTNPADVLATVKRVAAQGDDERTREWVGAATGRANAGALAAVARQVEDKDAGAARHWGAAVDEVERQLGWFDRHVEGLLKVAGTVPTEVREGRTPEKPLDTRVLGLWADNLDGRTGAAFEASKEYEARVPEGLAEAIAEGGQRGWDATNDPDATDDHSVAQAQGDPNHQTDAPADAQADQADAGVTA